MKKIKSNKFTIKPQDLHLRNELHFQACQQTNVAYVSKNKKKIIPRKQKYFKKTIDI